MGRQLCQISDSIELNDIMFLIKSLKSPSSSFNIYNFISFTSSSTRSSARNKFRSTNTLTRHFYFARISRLWNLLPVIDLTLPISTLHSSLKEYFWSHLISHFWQYQPLLFPHTLPMQQSSTLPKTDCHINFLN